MNPAEFQNIAAAEEEMWWFAGMRRILGSWIKRLPSSNFDKVLEAGCGTGYISHWLCRQYGWRMFPTDLDFGGLLHGRRSGLSRLSQCDIRQIPYRDASFDAIISLDVLVHFERGSEQPAIQEFERVLKPGGKLILRVSALDILSSRHSTFAHERQRFTRARLVAAIEKGGFQLLDCSYANSLLLPVALIKFRVWETLTRQPPRSGVQVPAAPLNQLLKLPLMLEAFCLGRGWKFPLGQSLLVLAQKKY